MSQRRGPTRNLPINRAFVESVDAAAALQSAAVRMTSRAATTRAWEALPTTPTPVLL